jgi:hypothetical protein
LTYPFCNDWNKVDLFTERATIQEFPETSARANRRQLSFSHWQLRAAKTYRATRISFLPQSPERCDLARAVPRLSCLFAPPS